MLVVCCGDELTMETLNCADVTDVLKAVTGEKLGRDVAVRYVLGRGKAAGPAAGAEDKLDSLIRQGQRYDSFTVK